VRGTFGVSPTRNAPVKSIVTIRLGGLALIVGAIAFMGVFAYLAARFNYPAVLDGTADTVLPALLATGTSGRAAWALYGLLPLIWLPAGVGAYRALAHSHPGGMLLALQFAALSAISMMLGLFRWPSIHWRLAQSYVEADPAQQRVLAATFDGLNLYLGNYLGEFLGELSFSAFFILTSWALLRSRTAPRWVAASGLLTGVLGWVGMFRNVTTSVAPVAALNNYLLPLWMIVLGVVLLRAEESGPGPASLLVADPDGNSALVDQHV
jgi:hypothetical protein